VALPITPSPRNGHNRSLLGQPVAALLDAHPTTLHHATPKRKLDSRQVCPEDDSQ
jgi:hypothetical protein